MEQSITVDNQIAEIAGEETYELGSFFRGIKDFQSINIHWMNDWKEAGERRPFDWSFMHFTQRFSYPSYGFLSSLPLLLLNPCPMQPGPEAN